jgi:DNA-binding Lrp family transcriptional regulator
MKETSEILEQNARATQAQIVTMVDKPVREVQKIIKRAEIRVSSIIRYQVRLPTNTFP